MSKILVLVGPPGSGKSSIAEVLKDGMGYVRINQDDQGKEEHKVLFQKAINEKKDIIIDRMNFSKEQRERYLSVARQHGYETNITVLHESYETCYTRCLNRRDHPTIKNETDIQKALGFFFKNYERPTDSEADIVYFNYPLGDKPSAIICDLDGTLCNIEHRLHHVQRTDGKKKDWKAFSEGLKNDTPNAWCGTLLRSLMPNTTIVYCSGRDNSYRAATEQWLTYNVLDFHSDLFMRPENNFREDYIVKETILDFEILTRYTPLFMIDDRKQVVDMWRRRGFTCLQCAPGDF